MRRDYVTVEVVLDEGGDDSPPVLAVTVDEGAATVPEVFTEPADSPLEAGDVDVALRRDGDGGGVLSIARRLTGEFLLEANVDPEAIAELVEAAGARHGETRYRLVLGGDSRPERSLGKRTLLVYDADGNLEREASLIPSGVEL